MKLLYGLLKSIKTTPSEDSLIKFINVNNERFIKMNIKEVSKKSFVSLGVITKLVKKFGFNNFKDLQIYVAQEIVRNGISEINLQANDVNGLSNNIKASYKLSIETTADNLRIEDIETVVDLLKSSNNILSYGVGVSKLPAQLFVDNLSILGKNAKLIRDIHDFILWVDLKKIKKTLVVLFSNTLKTPEIIKVIKLCEQYKIMTVVITNNRIVKEKVNFLLIRFNIYETEEKNSLMSYSHKISQLFIVDLISRYLMELWKYKSIKIPRKSLLIK